jgi:tRNA pseudouridine32 synthase/23S rRNA pseudouridine746 synthase
MRNAQGEEADLIDIFKDYKSPFPEEEYIAYKEGRITTKPRGKYGVPPGGAGECCAPKLLQHAYLNGLKPICMGEFWMGPSMGNQMRIEGNFYPSCQHKCVPILTFMLKGLNVEENPLVHRSMQLLKQVRILHEEDDFLIVYKPSGLLSVPGKNHGEPSLMEYLSNLNPNYVLMHRLDQDTSGVMIAAKNREACHWIQQLFMEHKMIKKYVAILDEPLKGEHLANSYPKGTITLPLSKNPFDSPRQVVDHRFGKPAFTYYEFTSHQRIELFPESGRTHQLRIHCAHPEGLGIPIKGDILYGSASDRLYLHAESLSFCHPLTGKWMHFEDKAF